MKVFFNTLAFIIFTFLFGISLRVMSFPETVRHGYLSCSSCHYSPNGGGLLTPYGKTIAKELYSISKTKEAEGTLEEETPWWQVGAQFRVMQLLTDSHSVQRARLFPMQSEVMGAVTKQNLSIVASLAAWRHIDAEKEKLKAYTRNFYLLYQWNENWLIRLGKFKANYGLGLPDHTVLTQQEMGWSFFNESNNGEVNYISEDNVFQLVAIYPTRLLVSEESFKGQIFTYDRLINSKHKIGFNIAHLWKDDIEEFQQNIHSVVSLSEKSYLQWELSYRNIKDQSQQPRSSLLARYSQELSLGWRPYVQIEHGVLETIHDVWAQKYYLGTQWFPANYFDLQFYIGVEKQTTFEDNKVVSLQGHFYF